MTANISKCSDYAIRTPREQDRVPIEFAHEKIGCARKLAAVCNRMGERIEDGPCFCRVAFRQKVKVAVARDGIFIEITPIIPTKRNAFLNEL